jgi:hypothetical protein
VLQANLDPDEVEGLHRSAGVLREVIRQTTAGNARP